MSLVATAKSSTPRVGTPSKKRVWDFFKTTTSNTSATWSKPQCSCPEIETISTTIVSGVHYNTFRYYDPILGRYTKRDPIGEHGFGAVRPIPAALRGARTAVERLRMRLLVSIGTFRARGDLFTVRILERLYSRLGRDLQSGQLLADYLSGQEYTRSTELLGHANQYDFCSNSALYWVDPDGAAPTAGGGTAEGRRLYRELMGISDEEAEQIDKENEKALDAFSDTIKDVMTAPLPTPNKCKWGWKALKALLMKVWKKTDPGEKFPEPTNE